MIRKGTIEDLPRLDALARIIAQGLHADGIDQWSDRYPALADFAKDRESGGLWVAEEEGLVIGSLSLLPDQDEVYRTIDWPEGSALVIHRIMVDPGFRRNGVGRLLMEQAFRVAKTAGFAAIKVDTHPDNFRMQTFLTSFGFRQVGYLAPIHRLAYFRRLEE